LRDLFAILEKQLHRKGDTSRDSFRWFEISSNAISMLKVTGLTVAAAWDASSMRRRRGLVLS
jgi:hypothetical protein